MVRPKLWWMEAREELPLGNHFLVVCGLFSAAVTILMMMKAHPLVAGGVISGVAGVVEVFGVVRQGRSGR